jgi:hypothetical protein
MRQNIKSVFIIGLSLLFSTGCATIHRRDVAQFNVIPIFEVMENSPRRQDIAKEITEGKTVIFKVDKGQAIPLKLNLDIPVCKSIKSENMIVFIRDVYLSISQTRFEISPDGQRWASFGDIRALKKLFGIREGTFSVAYLASQFLGTFISVDVKAK